VPMRPVMAAKISEFQPLRKARQAISRAVKPAMARGMGQREKSSVKVFLGGSQMSVSIEAMMTTLSHS